MNPLNAAAPRHVRDMDSRNVAGHTGSDGSDIAQRIGNAGYLRQAIAENVAKVIRIPDRFLQSGRRARATTAI